MKTGRSIVITGAAGWARSSFAAFSPTEMLSTQRTPRRAPLRGCALGANVGTMVKLVAENVEAVTLEGYGHFVPEESSDEIVQRVLKLVRKTQR